MQQEEHYGGTLRISNPKTLQRWIETGKFKEQYDKGYVFNVGCGRFTYEYVCTCTMCRNRKRPELVEVLDRFNLLNK